MSGPAVVRTVELTKSYGSLQAVRGLDLTVRRGEIYGFLGPNGAGKTTTLLMLLGIQRPTSGQLELFGHAAPFDPFAVKRRIGVLGESQYLYDDLSAWEHLAFFGALYGVDDWARRARELLERLGLWELRQLRARDHSRGMQQKLGLARALLHRPELLVLDEPVSGLDPHGIRQVREVLIEENARGTTVLISSHILSEVERTAHRVGVLHGGRLVAEDTVAAIGARLQPDAAIEVEVDGFEPGLVEALRAEPFVRDVEWTPIGHLRVAVRPDGEHRRAVSQIVTAHGGVITAMRQETLSLEDAFVSLTKESPLPVGRRAVGERPQPAGPPSPPGRAEGGRSAREGALAAGLLAAPGGRRCGGASPLPSTTGRGRAMRVLLVKELRSTLVAPGLYVSVSLGALAAALVVRNDLDAIERSRVLVLADAFALPFFAAGVLAMLFLTLCSLAGVAREREQGTLEALFYGPVDEASYLLGKHGAQVAAFAPMVLAIGALLLVYAATTGLGLSARFPLELLLSLFTAAAVSALGLLLSTLTGGARAAFGVFGALVVGALGIRFGAEALAGLAVANNQSPLLFLRDLLVAADAAVGAVSPFGVFQNGMDALVREDVRGYALAIGVSVAETAALLWLSVRVLVRRGVRR